MGINLRKYRYKAAFRDGKLSCGTASAENAEGLRKALGENGLTLIDYSESRVVSERPLCARRLSEFCRELASMLKSGVPVSRALEIIIKRENNTNFRKLLNEVCTGVKRGASLSSALEEQGGAFPPLLVNMVSAGEAGGKLFGALARMADYYEKEYRAKSEIRSAMMYPAILGTVTVLVVVAVFAFIFPVFSDLLAGAELPPVTEVMMFVSSLFTDKLYILLFAVIAATAVVSWLGSLETVRCFFDRMKLRLPFVGRLFRIICTARFARTLSSLYSGGLPVILSLETSFSVAENSYIRSQADGVIRRVAAGEPMSAALGTVDGFDEKLAAALAVGEEAGRIEELLDGISDSYDFEASVAVRKLIKLIEPIMIFVMSVIILAVVMSVMLPIYDMYESFGSGLL